MSSKTPEAPAIDLSSCAREPIHIPGSIQGHGVLLHLDELLNVLQVSVNTTQYFNATPEALLNAPLQNLLGANQASALAARLFALREGDDPLHLETLSVADHSFHAIGHCRDSGFILEFEPVEANSGGSGLDINTAVRRSISGLKRAADLPELATAAAMEVRALTGFDRVLVYRFDETWNGHVIGEDKVEDWASYLDLWFPASDIPQQARKLYEVNRLRLIADTRYTPVPVTPPNDPRTGKPLDLSASFLRSVSPVHLEYLHNMGVASSMSVSLLNEEGHLWGLIACHHRTPKFLSFQLRNVCETLAYTLSSRIANHELGQAYERRIRLNSITTSLLQYMSGEEDFLEALAMHPEDLLAFGLAGGAALLHDGQCRRVGECPDESEILRLADWLVERGRVEVYATDNLPDLIEASPELARVASGLLAISISSIHHSYILWFRPEVIQTVKWGGDPRKPVENSDEPQRLHPRKSFETWKQIVSRRSLPWHETETQAAAELRNAVIGIVLRKAEELAGVTEELRRSNKELEAFSYSVSHDLRAPFRHIVAFSELLKQSSSTKLDPNELRFLNVIIESGTFAGQLIDHLLSFSQVGRAKLKFQSVPSAVLVRDVRRDLATEAGERKIDWKIDPLPEVTGDLIMLRLVWQNLLQNALKYTRKRDPAIIQISAEKQEGEYIFTVRDNGVGFDQRYADKLFGVFQRLHRMEDYEGTGIGLANVRRIVSRHQGRTWAEGRLEQGAAFYFSLPVSPVTAS